MIVLYRPRLFSATSERRRERSIEASGGPAGEIAAETGVFWTYQLNNLDILEGYRAIGEELLAQLPGSPAIDALLPIIGCSGAPLAPLDHPAERTRSVQDEQDKPA